MCGIIGVVRRRATRQAPQLAPLLARLDDEHTRLSQWDGSLDPLLTAAATLAELNTTLGGVPGIRALIDDPVSAGALGACAQHTLALVAAIECRLDTGEQEVAGSGVEDLNAALLEVRDPLWAIRNDRIRNAHAVADLAGPGASRAAIEGFASVQIALSALDRLEVRGRDSAGLHLLVRGHGCDLADEETRRRIDARAADPLFGAGSVRTPDGLLAFVYKAAAEIGELGDNTRHLRNLIRDDDLLHDALESETAEVNVLGHTRWASVGIISEANAHPLNSEEVGRSDPYVAAALNGDVDNYSELIATHALHVPPEITTDAKVIPALIARARADAPDPSQAFRAAVSALDGSVAVGAIQAEDPASLFLALRGSGQALYVGLAEDAFVVASEPYGLVEETATYVRLDGETPADSKRSAATRGQVVVIDGAAAGTLDGITRLAYDGTPLPMTDADLQVAQITTRDIDRGSFPHFLLKEISEAPDSFRKTLRGKITETPGSDDSGESRLQVRLGPETLSDQLVAALQSGAIRRVSVIGQGTAAVAGQSLALALEDAVGDRLVVEALPATELSGFGLRADMGDTLVIAISQSGTTTDTNRTVDLARERGATVVAIVNRRNSDLVDKSNGVLYTSDGRDVEMSVASTKAFYAQVAAGYLLALAIAAELGVDGRRAQPILAALRQLPNAMRSVLTQRDAIAGIAQREVLGRRYWAVVGNGRNVVAARELRIKLSELCYKAIACDVTEDKKHIDLSSEPLVLVCAAGLGGSNVDDVTKEVAIYGAHRAAPVVIATSDDATRFAYAREVIPVPAVHPALDFVLSTMAGHLFCYEAALAIDASARPLRESRAAIEAAAAGPPEALLDRLAPRLDGPARRFLDGLRAGHYDGTLEASTATRLSSLLRYAAGGLPLDSYELEHGNVGTPSTIVQDLTAALTKAIEELTRPIDAIKHQAKTVTVGISRSDETLLHVPLVREVLAAGAPRDALSYQTLRTLAELDPAVAAVTGYTRYRIEGDVGADTATVHVVDRGGVAATISSRTDTDPRLRGSKHRVANRREVTAVRGWDGRTLVVVPEVKHNQTVGLTLLHVRFAEFLTPDAMRAVLQGYQGRYGALKDAVTETEFSFDDTVLTEVPVIDALTEPVYVLADRWRRE
jgi:glucosamine--fructose-6-phosphate aminotransferase (isomerizing)